MRTIFSRYLSPTRTKGKRIKAYDQEGFSVTISIEAVPDLSQRLGDNYVHAHAVEQLCRKMRWKGNLVGGNTKQGMAWVFVDGAPRTVLQDNWIDQRYDWTAQRRDQEGAKS